MRNMIRKDMPKYRYTVSSEGRDTVIDFTTDLDGLVLSQSVVQQGVPMAVHLVGSTVDHIKLVHCADRPNTRVDYYASDDLRSGFAAIKLLDESPATKP